MDSELLQRLGAALAIGALIGVERGWKQRDGDPGSRAAGLRTFTLAGVLGGVAAVIGLDVGAPAFAALAAAFAAVFGVFLWRDSLADDDFSATSAVAGLLTFSLGALAGVGSVQEAATAAVAVVCILAFKESLHAWLRGLTWPEIRSALAILAMSLIALPLLPTGPVDPWGLLNVRELWFLTILIATISFAGYIAVRLFGPRAGLALGAGIGALVSSTLVVAELAGRVSRKEISAFGANAAASLSTLIMLGRIAVLASVLAPALVPQLLPVLAASTGVSAAGAALLLLPRSAPPAQGLLPALKSPLNFRSVLQFAALIGGLSIAATLTTRSLGDAALLPLAAVSGLADVDAVLLTVTRLNTLAPDLATAAILLAALANMVSKSVIVFVAGGMRFGAYFTATSLIAGGAGGLVFAGMYAQ